MPEKTDVEILREKAGKITEDDFISVPDTYGNELCLYIDDFPEIAKEDRGSPVMFVIRGAIKGIRDEMSGPIEVCSTRKRVDPKLDIYVFDIALVHGRRAGKSGKKSGRSIMKYAEDK